MDKVCGICGEDCSDRPRVKDTKGRYYCKTCAMAKASETPDAETPAARVDDADPYDLDAGDAPGDDLMPTGLVDSATPTKACPVCMRSMDPAARICVSCGYDAEKGIQSSTKIEKSAGKGRDKNTRAYRCKACGYNIEGLREPVCPECGERVPLSQRGRMDDEIRSQVLEEEYKKPAIWFGVGFVIVAVALAIQGNPMGFVGYAVDLAIQLPFMLVGLWMCQKTFLGDIGTPLLNTVRLASALALANAVDTLIPIHFFFVFTVGTFVYLGVLMDLFEIDLSDAIWVAVVMFILKLVAAFVAVFVATTYLGMTI